MSFLDTTTNLSISLKTLLFMQIGIHLLLLDVYLKELDALIDNYNTWIKGSDHESLKSQMEEILNDSGFTILNFIDHKFLPEGYTALWLLAESHCALHTFPEANKTYIELSSCNRQMYVDFVKIFNTTFHNTV